MAPNPDKLTKAQPNLHAMRHSAEHVLTQAILQLYGPKLKMAMGPATDEGFYFDFDLPASETKVSADDFPRIEKVMHQIISQNLPITREEVTPSVAKKLFVGNTYKQEWISEAKTKGEPITLYWTGKPGDKDSFVDLCAGPHVTSTGQIKAFKLLSLAGAYWHGDEKNIMLTRIYGTAFPTQAELDHYLWQIDEAKKRDHRKLGKQLDLFTFSDLVGSGLPLYTPKGALIRRLLNEYVESIQSQQGYQQVWTPQIAKAELFKTSGHYDKYKDNMFRVKSNYSTEEFFLKPMNCPQHTQIYASRPRSYKELPLRLTDFAMLYRDEKPGELSGLARVRSFSQDDCHIFCREDQVDDEVDKALSMIKQIMQTLGFKYRYRLSTRDPQHPEKYIGNTQTWDKLEQWAVKIMQRNHIDYFDGPGEAAFYGPKMDLMTTDALGREWQLSTVQIDYFMPQRFKLEYIDSDGSAKQPVMIHRAIVGSPERMLMILIEHYAGAFPTWLAPIQTLVLPISEKQAYYAQEVAHLLQEANIRCEVDATNESLSKRIRTAELQKIPYILVVGEREAQSNSVSIRKRGQEKQLTLPVSAFISQILQEIATKKI